MATTIRYFPFDGGDGADSSEDRWGNMMKYMRTTGIVQLTGTLSATGDNALAPQLNMQIQAYDGEAWIEGFMFIHTDDTYPIVISDNNDASGDDRIDLVTLRLDKDANTIAYNVIEGTVDPAPVAPSPVQNDTVWDLPLAEVYVANGATVINSADITDVRVLSVQQDAPAYGGFYFSSTSATTIAMAGTYYKAAGTTTTTNLSLVDDDSGTDNRLRYTGSGTRLFQLQAFVSVTLAVGANQDIAVQLYHYDDSAASGSLLTMSDAHTTVPGSVVVELSTLGDVLLDTNDYIEIHVTNVTNANDIVVEYGYLGINGVLV